MESIDAHSSEPSVEDITPNDVKWGYYCPRLMDHSELKPFDVLTSLHPKNETRLAVVGGTKTVATLTWPSVGVKPNTWKSWGFGVLRDSRMFRVRQQDPKHLASGCSWCHWKVLEA